MAQQLAASIASLDGGFMVDISAVYISDSTAPSFNSTDVKNPFAILLDTVTNISTRYNLAVWTQSEIDAINANAGSPDASWNYGNPGQAVGAIKLGENLEITGLVNGRKYVFTQIGSKVGSSTAEANVFSTASVKPVGPSDAPILGIGEYTYHATAPVLKVYMTLGADHGAIPDQMRLSVVDASDSATVVDYLSATEIQSIRTNGYHQIDDASQLAILVASEQKNVTVTAAVLTSTGLSSSIAVREYELRASASAPTLVSVKDVTEPVWDFENHSNTNVSVGGKLKVTFTAGGEADSFEIQTRDTSGNDAAWETIRTVPYVITHGTTSGAYVYEIDVPIGSLNDYRVVSKQVGKNDGVSDVKAQYDLYNPKLQLDVVEKAYTSATKMYGTDIASHNVADYNEYELNFVTGASSSYEQRDISLGAITLKAGQPGSSPAGVSIFAIQAASASPNSSAQCEAGLFKVRALVATADLNPADILTFELASNGYTGKFPAGIVTKANTANSLSTRNNTNPVIDSAADDLLAAALKSNSVSIPAVPEAPTLDASNVNVFNGNGEGVITWEDLNTGNNQPTSFLVELYTDLAMTGSRAAFASTTTEYAKVVGLTNGFTYYIRITSINAAGRKVTNVPYTTNLEPATTYTAVQISNVTLTESTTNQSQVILQFDLPALSDSRQEFTSMSVREIDAEGKYLGTAQAPTLLTSYGGRVSTTQKHAITTHTGTGGLKQFFITCTAASESDPTANAVVTLPYFISVTMGSKPDITDVTGNVSNYKTYVKVTVDNCGNQITGGAVLGIPAAASLQFGAAPYTGNTSADLEFFSQAVGSNTEVWTATLPFVVFDASGGELAIYTHISNSEGTDSVNDIGIDAA